MQAEAMMDVVSSNMGQLFGLQMHSVNQDSSPVYMFTTQQIDGKNLFVYLNNQ